MNVVQSCTADIVRSCAHTTVPICEHFVPVKIACWRKEGRRKKKNGLCFPNCRNGDCARRETGRGLVPSQGKKTTREGRKGSRGRGEGTAWGGRWHGAVEN